MSYRRFTQDTRPRSLGWRGVVENIRENDKEWERVWSIASPLERQQAKEKRASQVSRYVDNITKGILEAHASLADDVIRAEGLMKRAKTAEINSWEADRLNSEITLAQTRLDKLISSTDRRINKGEQVKAFISEADQSGDRYKIRAWGEVLVSAYNNKGLSGLQERTDINRLGLEQQENMIALRTSPEMTRAKETADLAYDQYENETKELGRISELIDEGDPFHALATNPLSDAFKEFKKRP